MSDEIDQSARPGIDTGSEDLAHWVARSLPTCPLHSIARLYQLRTVSPRPYTRFFRSLLEVVRKWTEADHEKFDRNLIRIGGGEYALVAAIARDFFVCEERDTHYTVQSTPRTQRKSRLGIKIRYLPRFRVRYVGLREQEYRSQRVQVVGHHVCGHLRRCKTASPLQLRLANQLNVEVPDGFTFVQPHDRGGHSRVLYRSRSALRMIYGEAIEHTTETQK